MQKKLFLLSTMLLLLVSTCVRANTIFVNNTTKSTVTLLLNIANMGCANQICDYQIPAAPGVLQPIYISNNVYVPFGAYFTNNSVNICQGNIYNNQTIKISVNQSLIQCSVS